MKVILLVSLCVVAAFAAENELGPGPGPGQMPPPDQCDPNKEAVMDFDINKYIGKWYQVQRNQEPEEPENICIQTEFMLKPDGSISVNASQLTQPENKLIAFDVPLKMTNPEEKPLKGKMDIVFAPNAPVIHYIIHDTDYTNYAIIYTCVTESKEMPPVETFVILSRTPKLSAEAQETVNGIVTKLKIEKLHEVVQDKEKCHYE